MKYEVTYTASYTVEAASAEEAIKFAIFEHEDMPDGDWEPRLIPAAPDKETIETHRARWAKFARANGWYAEPFYVQVWQDPDTGKVYDSVSHAGMTNDIVVVESEEL